MSEQANHEIFQLLRSFQGERLDLPDAIVHYWQRVIETVTGENPNWDEARNCCEYMTAILAELQANDRDVMRVDKAEGLVSLLLGAIHLGQKNYREAIDSFEQGAEHLQRWRDKDFQSLAYFGRVLAHKEEKNWSGALEAAQKALDAIRDLPLRHRSKHMKSLRERIKQEIILATEASLEEKKAPPTVSPKPSKPSRPKFIKIPIVSNIAAGLVRPITDENTKDHLLLSDNYCSNADFGVTVVGDSMKGDGILPRDLALIRQQPTVEDGEIAAVVITTPKQPLEVIKRYYHDQREGLQHWFLESSNPSSRHLLVMPADANVEAIQVFYAKEIQVGKVELYKNAELTIAGKYVGLVRKV
jgi:SOS-response transcriptional repressor LexA